MKCGKIRKLHVCFLDDDELEYELSLMKECEEEGDLDEEFECGREV